MGLARKYAIILAAMWLLGQMAIKRACFLAVIRFWE